MEMYKIGFGIKLCKLSNDSQHYWNRKVYLFPSIYSNDILVGKRGRKKPLERLSLGWESIIKMDNVT